MKGDLQYTETGHAARPFKHFLDDLKPQNLKAFFSDLFALIHKYWRGLLIVCLVLAIITVSLLMVNSRQKNLDQYPFWVVGDAFELPANINDFPKLFPNVYKTPVKNATTSDFDPFVATAESEGTLYFGNFSYDGTGGVEITRFSMLFGQPDSMTLYGITFGMTKDEVESALSNWSEDAFSPLQAETEIWNMWLGEYRPDLEERISEVYTFDAKLRIAYDHNGVVCGMQIEQ